MEEKLLLYALAIATTVNTVLLIILVIVLIRLSLAANKVMEKAENLMEYTQKEIYSTIAVTRKAIQQGGIFLEKISPAVQRYMMFATLRKISSPRISRIITGIGIGYGFVQSFNKYNQKK